MKKQNRENHFYKIDYPIFSYDSLFKLENNDNNKLAFKYIGESDYSNGKFSIKKDTINLINQDEKWLQKYIGINISLHVFSEILNDIIIINKYHVDINNIKTEYKEKDFFVIIDAKNIEQIY